MLALEQVAEVADPAAVGEVDLALRAAQGVGRGGEGQQADPHSEDANSRRAPGCRQPPAEARRLHWAQRNPIEAGRGAGREVKLTYHAIRSPRGAAAVARTAALVATTLLLNCSSDRPSPGDTPGDGGDTGIPPIELPHCPEDRSLAGWSAVGEIGMDDHVWDLAAADAKSPLGPALFACGDFLKADGLTVNHVARWDGSTWTALSGPSASGVDGTCTSIEIHPVDGLLYAGGSFEKAGGEWVFRFARWDGSDWSDSTLRLDSGTLYDLEPYDLFADADPELVAGGSFVHGSSLLFNGLAWTGPGAHGNLGPFPDVGVDIGQGYAMTLETVGSDLFVGGHFGTIGTLKTNNVARLVDLKTFAALDQGVGIGHEGSFVIQDMAGYQGDLYVGGMFDKASGVWASNLARWDGETWWDVQGGADNIVEGLLSANIGDGTALYVAGFFEHVGEPMWPDAPPSPVDPVAARYIARYDNGVWSPLGSGLGPPKPQPDGNHGMVMTTWDDGDGTCLYVGGRFETAGGTPAANVARWCC